MGLLMLPPLVPASLVAPVLGAELELELGLGDRSLLKHRVAEYRQDAGSLALDDGLR